MEKKFKNLRILSDAKVEIEGTYVADDYILEDGFIRPKNKKKYINTYDHDIHYVRFLELGKRLYKKCSKYIIPREHREYSIFESPLLGIFIYNKEDEEIIMKLYLNIVYEWLKEDPTNTPIYLTEYPEDIDSVEIKILCDVAMYSYMIITLLANHYWGSEKLSKYKETECLTNTEIKVSDLVTCKDKIPDFYDLKWFINWTFSIFDFHSRHRVLSSSLKIHVKESEEDKSYSIKCYSDIVSFYWEVLKLEIYSMENNYSYVNLCTCFNVIKGREQLCPDCKKLKDKFRKTEERERKKKLDL